MTATRRAHAVRRAGGAAADRVVLDYRDRFLRRKLLRTQAGAAVLVDLAETVSLEDGDALVLEDGTLLAVQAAAEPLLEVTAAPEALARLAWHIGNRHTPAEITANRILVQRDHVMADMLARLGATVRAIEAPFRPEGGAYGLGRTHGHHHGGATDDPDQAPARDAPRDHSDDHGPAQRDADRHEQPHGHDHGRPHGHDHSHDDDPFHLHNLGRR